MEDEKLKGLFDSPNEIYFCSKDDATIMPPLPVVADSVKFEAHEPTPLHNPKSFSFSFECDPIEGLTRSLGIARSLNTAQRMLDDLKRDARDFNTNPPKNRRERRKRQRMIRDKLKCFNEYCKLHNISLQKGES